jgi:predicted ATPase
MVFELAEHQPVLLIVEDLHWTDPSTLEWLGMLIEQAPTAALMLLLTCRPEFVSPWGRRSHLTPLALHRLSRAQVEVMVQRLSGGKTIPAAVMQHLAEKTDGVPLYIEEMTRAILEAGVLRETANRYELVGPLTSLAIPATLQDSLMARLDRLGPAKGIAQLGATIGRTFAYELLRAVAPLDEASTRSSRMPRINRCCGAPGSSITSAWPR